jgi:HD-GYP domain-containing protein (c-di-GMP phosphodiesterase class II)
MGGKMSDGTMTVIEGRSLDLGELPFDIHAKDPQGRLVLYGRKGVMITPETRQKIINSRRQFYIQHEEVSAFIDNKLDRINQMLDDEDVDIEHKQEMVKDASTKILQRIENTGLDKVCATHSKNLARAIVSIILKSPENHVGLLKISSLPSYFYDHALNTATFAIMLGHCMYGPSEQKLYMLGLGALLMDVGMCRLNKGILNKTKELDPKEADYIRNHTKLGFDMIDSEDLPSFVADIALHHHERMDGSGYPDGISGNKIKPYLRICSVADVYDALTSLRAHRKPMSELEAIDYMLENRNQFSMDVLNALLKVVLRDDRLIEKVLEKHGQTT